MSFSRKEIVSTFLKKGYLIDPLAVDFFEKNTTELKAFLKSLDKKKSIPKTITVKYVNKILAKTSPKINIDVIGELVLNKKERVTVEFVVGSYTKLYEIMKKILENKMPSDLISINRVQKQKNFSLIIMVREIDFDNNTIVAEDPTGEILLKADKKIISNIKEDDILGVVCGCMGDIPQIKKIIWPDIPLKRDVKKASDAIKCLFISGLDFTNANFKKNSYDKFIDWLSKNYKELIIFILPPCFLEDALLNKYLKIIMSPTSIKTLTTQKSKILNCNAGLVSISNITFLVADDNVLKKYAFACNPKSETTSKSHIDTMVSILKRRVIQSGKDFLVLDPLPDIFVTTTKNKPAFLNYKGTTLISTGSFLGGPIFWILDLKTREINKLDFS